MRTQKSFVAYTYTLEDRSVKRRKHIRIWALVILTIFFLLVASAFLVWQFSAAPEWRMLVVDKTAPHTDYREHRSLFWALNHVKATNKGGEHRWSPDKNYVGFYPEKFIASDAAFSANLEADHIIGVNLIFIADTYGVYVDDFKYPQQHHTHQDYSRKIFGGLEHPEVDIIEGFVKEGGSLVAEFNTFNDPTPNDVQERMESLLGVRSTGWVGRYFADLANRQDVPSWALRNWQAQQGEEWDFAGPGFIIAHEDSRILVLRTGIELGAAGLQIAVTLPADPLMKSVSSSVPYPYWFDIVAPAEGTEVLAEYRLDLKPEGQLSLKMFAIPESFPAVLRASESPLRLYLAGDFSDSNVSRGPYFFFGWPQIRRVLSLIGKNKSQNRFFWGFYLPLLENLFKNGF
jgi:hypothetical protein